MVVLRTIMNDDGDSERRQRWTEMEYGGGGLMEMGAKWEYKPRHRKGLVALNGDGDGGERSYRAEGKLTRKKSV